MSSLGAGKGLLEIAKFGVYLAVPIGMTYAVATNSKTLQKLMGLRNYVVYPPNSEVPPTPEEIREMAKDIAEKNKRS